MKNFGRALLDAFGFWPLLLVATLCAVGNGAIWGLNIGALFPVIEVTIAGESLHDWIDGEIIDSRGRIEELDRQLTELDAKIAATDRSAEAAAFQVERELLQTKLEAERAGLESSLRMRPWIVGYLPDDPFKTVVFVMLGVLACTLLKHVFQFANTWIVALVAARITRKIQTKIFAKALILDQTSFNGYTSSGFVAHITYTTNMLSGGITSVYGGAVREPLKLIACLVGAALICPRLLLLTLLVVPFVGGLIYWLGRSLKRVCQSLLERAMGLHHVMLESLNNIRTVQAYCREEHEQERFDKATMDMQRFTMRIVSFNALNRPLTELLALGMMATAVVAGSYLVMYQTTEIFGIQITSKRLGPAAMLVFFGMLVGASDPVRKFASVIDGINSGAVAANLLYPMLDQPTRINNPEHPVSTPRPHRVLRLEHVDFAYDDSNRVLSDVSLEIPHGATVAIVGANGSGKSSLINLLCRFYDPQAGSVSLDEADVRALDLKDLRGRIALVTQNTELFNEDIYYNIGYGAENASREDILRAAEAAHADTFIRNDLPNQYETVLGQNGQRLSGGQRQRIALARALVRDPDILILDEATSQVDVESERLIFDTIREQCRHRTVFIVTHRHGTLEMADIILRFDRGNVHVEKGSAAVCQPSATPPQTSKEAA